MSEIHARLAALGIALAMAMTLLAAAWLRDAPRLPVSTLVVESAQGTHAFTVELADTDATRDRGLQGRETLPPDRGLLIDYGEPRVGVVFWMKDTPLSLDIVFVGPDGKILRIEERAAPGSEVPIPAGGIIRAVLEVRGGLTRRLGIAPGDRVRHAIFADARS